MTKKRPVLTALTNQGIYLRRLVGVLDRHLQETHREVLVDLACDPELEVLVDGLCVESHDFLRQSITFKNSP